MADVPTVSAAETAAKLDKANALTILGAGAQATKSLISGVGDYQDALARSAVAAQNAISYRYAAELAAQRGKESVVDINLKTQQLLGAQRAALAANGVVVDTGTSVEVAAQAAGIGASDAMAALNKARQEAAAFLTRANASDAEAYNAKRSGRSSLVGALLGAGTSILGAASTISNRNSSMKLPEA